MIRIAPILAALLISSPLSAKDSLGIFSDWAAFRDADAPRCYAIAKPNRPRTSDAYATIGNWPRQAVRNQVHLRLSRAPYEGARVRLVVGRSFHDLEVRGRDAWAKDRQTNAAIIAALRSAQAMRVTGGGLSDRYDLSGVATAMDAATVGCAQS